MIRGLATAFLLATLLPVASGRAERAEPLPRRAALEHRLEIPDSLPPEIHFKLRIPLNEIVFRRRPEGYRADLRIACEAIDRDSDRRESLLLRDRVELPDFAASRRQDQWFEKEFRLPLGPGDWRLETRIYGRGAARPWLVSDRVEVPRQQEGRFFLQGPLWQGPAPERGLTPPFRMEDPWQISDEVSRFADAGTAEPTIECDALFWSESGAEAEAMLRVVDRAGTPVHFARRRFAAAAGRNPLKWTLPIARLGMDAYLVEIEVAAGRERRHVRGRLDVGLTRAAFDRDWERTLELLDPLAEAGERDSLAAAPLHERLAAWQRFWERRDESDPLLQERYFQRLDEANRRFWAQGTPGYRTDRGKVFLELGAPDRIEVVQDEGGFRVREYWYYSLLARIYVFEDRHGTGSFELLQVSG